MWGLIQVVVLIIACVLTRDPTNIQELLISHARFMSEFILMRLVFEWFALSHGLGSVVSSFVYKSVIASPVVP